jgi:hypothetical protein
MKLYKNKYFEKQVHIVGFTIGIYYDARTYERKNCKHMFWLVLFDSIGFNVTIPSLKS